jgi:hypothetical protein
MTSVAVAFVSVVQACLTVATYWPGVLRYLGVSGNAGTILLVLPSVAALVANAAILSWSPFLRSYRFGPRLAFVLAGAVLIAFLTFWVAMIIALNVWGT